ncbi:hypothetical protein KKD37_00320 [Patescibacteria group bacterium]|nr:hypothetical protein [Patescibacteria group bacterium]
MSQLSPQLVSEARKYLSPSQNSLINDVQTVLKSLEGNHIGDYSFLVAPASKAYEGYLKDFFLKTGIIDNYNYESDRFRVGKTLNPSLRYKRYSIYQKLAALNEEGEELAEKLWNAWKFGRNEIFHYFPNNLKNLSRDEAEERITMLLNAIVTSGRFYNEYLKGNLL